MKKLWFCLVLFIFLLPILASAATINVASCSYNDVLAAVNAAQSGDTVLVPAGMCTWTSTLLITKGIYLIGNGVGSTIIKNNANGNYLIRYNPSDYSRNDPVRISGFTFDLDNKGPGIDLGDWSKIAPFTIQTKARIDHNRFYNAPNNIYQAIWNRGTVRGLVDNNAFDSIAYPTRADAGVGGSSWWDSFSGIQYGTGDDNLYFEDNTFTDVSAGIISDCEWSGRYLFRYNTMTIPPVSHGSYPLFDMHGDFPGGGEAYSCFGGEIYGNKIDAGIYGVGLLDQRGGKALVFYNDIIAGDGGYIQVRNEFADSPTTNPIPQHVSDSYYWNNRVDRRYVNELLVGIAFRGPTGTATGGGNNYLEDTGENFDFCASTCSLRGLKIVGGTGAGQFRQISTITPTRIIIASNWATNPDATSQYEVLNDCCNSILDNRDFFSHNESFDGASGMGCGTLANRPASCTTGVGYWATTQSCSSVDSINVGAHPTSPISGTLYKCTAPNTWTAYYTPYTYPHPFRTDCTNYPGLCDSGSPPPTACTEHDWTHTDGACRSNNTLIRTWTKIGACTGGVTHPATETISCTYVPTTYYVSTTGNDSNPGTQAQPWRNIQKAANTMVAGDSVIVTAGDYSSERVNLTRSGSPGLPITYQAQGTVIMKGFKIIANYTTIKGFEIANTSYRRWDRALSAGVYVEGHYVTIEDNYIHDASLTGIYLYATPEENSLTTDCIIRNNRIFRVELVGIDVYGRNNLIEGNEVWKTAQCHPILVTIEGAGCPNYGAVGGLDADGMRFFGQGHIFRKNYIHDIPFGPAGVNPAIEDYNDAPHTDCFQSWTGTYYETAKNIIFDQNYCDNAQSMTSSAQSAQGFMIEGGPTENLTFRNNIIISNRCLNIIDSNNPVILNNDCLNNKSVSAPANSFGGFGLENAPNAIVKNNLLYDMQGHSICLINSGYESAQTGRNLEYRSDGQALWINDDWCHYNATHRARDLWGVNPLFVSVGAKDYHLQSSSPAINAGYDLTGLVSDDYEGNSRPQGAGYDIGAFEYSGGTSCVAADVNCDGMVNLVDLKLVASDFGKTTGFNSRADTNSNGVVDIYDAVFVASRFT